MKLIEKDKCCGCTACVSICPKSCISMISDRDGFSYPTVDISLCIDCHLCENVCPAINVKKNIELPLVYAAMNNDEFVRLQSSSGGIFTSVAEMVINRGGVVFGACFDSNWKVIHDYVETKEGLARFRGSKYVQSWIGDSFVKVKAFLDTGREVLFSGTPCQIIGLKNYLRRSYPNLLTVDLACHGVPSPEVWQQYLQETVCKVYGISKKKVINLGDYISAISFRSKDKGWKKFSVKIVYKNGKVNVLPFFENPYMSIFLSNLSLRPSCFVCSAKIHNVQSDITLADFWGINKLYPEIDDDKGCGLILLNNKDKLEFLRSLDCKLVCQSFDDAIKYNQSILYSVKEPKNRNFFFLIYRKKGFHLSYKAVTSNSALIRVVRKIYRVL